MYDISFNINIPAAKKWVAAFIPTKSFGTKRNNIDRAN